MYSRNSAQLRSPPSSSRSKGSLSGRRNTEVLGENGTPDIILMGLAAESSPRDLAPSGPKEISTVKG